MLMWGDRLLDGKKMRYGKWEAAANGTAPAIDRIPKDIILCDWHYEIRRALSLGAVLPGEGVPGLAGELERARRRRWRSWRRRGRLNKGLVIGHMGTTWAERDGAFGKALLEPGPARETKPAAGTCRGAARGTSGCA